MDRYYEKVIEDYTQCGSDCSKCRANDVIHIEQGVTFCELLRHHGEIAQEEMMRTMLKVL